MDRVHKDNLFAAARRINDTFCPLAGTDPTEEEVAALEREAREEINTVYIHLFALSEAELRVLAGGEMGFFFDSVSYEFSEIAHEVAETHFSERTKEGFFRVVGKIIDFFSTRESPGDESTADELFFFLRGMTSRNISNVIARISRSEKKLLHYIYTTITKHIRNSERYDREGDSITDLKATPPGKTARLASSEELVSICSNQARGGDRPGILVDLTFDCIEKDSRFISTVKIQALRSAIFELLRGSHIPDIRKSTKSDPLHDFLQKEMLKLAGESVEEALSSYGWREGGSAEFRELYAKAVRDILEEMIVHGRKPPFPEVFKRHLGEGGDVEYREKHRGSFQNFWKILWENFLKKFRAD
ncbi:MAG: hypothetical protein KAV42_08920 [Candidatus Krumholzibacteria bacterium]|nr:hypothetical protein [Candidatus Krumholzibacteria bacterium]